MAITLGINLPQTGNYDLTRDTVTAARAFEEIGYDSLWAFERVLAPVDQSGPHGMWGLPDVPWPARYEMTTDPLITLALAAAVTTRPQLGTGVLIAPLHVPARLAKSLASLDVASNGRLIAGLGTGWSIDEYDAVAPRPIAERGAALDEFLQVAAAVWGPDPVEFANERWRISPSRINPKPVRKIPVYLGGRGPAALRRIARHADGWLPTNMPAHEVGATLARLREMATDDRTLDVIFQLSVTEYDLPRLVDTVGALADAGVGHVYATIPALLSSVDAVIDRAAEFHTAVRKAGL
ncbi:TIGR03619 family F420-dependent LLM class oxidoreductase [Catenuloplanes japonicus]|uniref:TIGR03619 family F420-dependent LLM class oxidoreductase n=1 Tax=Catenuloplanes japonicus TaxID=33876 RepID=UPI000527BD56|nr:TIGR03619 family F420-dependent LLM class oxidoreductase [Catenuloplanes japonicus]